MKTSSTEPGPEPTRDPAVGPEPVRRLSDFVPRVAGSVRGRIRHGVVLGGERARGLGRRATNGATRGARHWADPLIRPRLGRLHIHPPQAFGAEPVRPDHRRQPVRYPRISVVTPSYNHGRFIGETIRSVVDQGYPNLQYRVQDGASTDETLDILKAYGAQQLSFESRPDDGQAHAINLGFDDADGEIMAWLNSDDLLMPGTLDYVGRFFARNPHVDVVYGHRVLVDQDTREIGRWVMPPHDSEVLSWADYVPQETLFWRRSIWERSGGSIDESLDFAVDWDLLLRFRQHGAVMVRLPRFLGVFRVHDAQKTSAAIEALGEEEMMALRERELGRVVDHPEIHQAVRPYLRRHVIWHLGWGLRTAVRGS